MKTRQEIVEFPQYISEIHHQSQQDEIFSLHKPAKAFYIFAAFAKSEAEPENSNLLQGEHQHAYLNRAFFVRSTRTPKENTEPKNRLSEFLSMAVRSGKGSPFAVFLVGQFLSPLRTVAQTLRSLAAVSEKSYKETAAMLFKFLLLGEKRLTVRICANTEAEARQRIQFTSPAICVARLPLPMNRFKAQGGVYA